ncbi:MAG: RtcB family protein [Thiothrix sp.]
MGTGNHFIEVCLDEDQAVWVMLHSGSRGVGNKIGSHFITQAKKEMERWFIQLPDKDLAYLPEGSQHFRDYVEAVAWAQDFAQVNREVMMARTLQAIRQRCCRKRFPPMWKRSTATTTTSAAKTTTARMCGSHARAR